MVSVHAPTDAGAAVIVKPPLDAEIAVETHREERAVVNVVSTVSGTKNCESVSA